MKKFTCLVLAIFAFGSVRAASIIEWNAISGNPIDILPLRHQDHSDHPQPPVVDANNWHPQLAPLAVNIKVLNENPEDIDPPILNTIDHRPFEHQPMLSVPEWEMGPPTPPPKEVPIKDQSRPRPNKGAAQKPQHGHFVISTEELNVVDGVVIPKPKYPADKPKKEINVYY